MPLLATLLTVAATPGLEKEAFAQESRTLVDPLAVVVYRIEVDHVAITHTAGSPFLLGMDSSPYWITFMILLWGAGLGMIIAALLRERDLSKAREEAALEEEQADSEEEHRGRWLH